MAAFKTGISTFMVILMVASLPFLQSSRPSDTFAGFQAQETIRADKKGTLQGLEIKQVDTFGNGDSVLGEDEESARQVPTGPDPLHHNDNPTSP